MNDDHFKDALALTLRFEGGYADHAADPGGATKYGITRAVLSDWRGRPVGKQEVAALRRSEAEAIYRRLYWDAAGCGSLPAGIGIALFDFAVNSGVDRACRSLQALLGIRVDGRVGRETIHAAHTADPVAVVRALCQRRRGFLARLPIFRIFGRGWLRRVAAVEALASERALAGTPGAVPFFSQQKELPAMILTKTALESRTVWANIVGLAALAARLFGFDVGMIDEPAVVDAILSTIAGASLVASTVFRVRATRLIG